MSDKRPGVIPNVNTNTHVGTPTQPKDTEVVLTEEEYYKQQKEVSGEIYQTKSEAPDAPSHIDAAQMMK